MRTFAFKFDPTAASNNLVPDSIALPLPILETNRAELELWRLNETESMQVFFSPAVMDGEQVEAATVALYEQILSTVPVSQIYRIWNFIPDINAPVAEHDRYMRFCKGRADVFKQQGHPDSSLSAASALGYDAADWMHGDACVVAIVMRGDAAIQPLENPHQIPAYQYPQVYGPRPPSFARAVVLEHQRVLISGTASILQSESQHACDPFRQACLAAENVKTLLNIAPGEYLEVGELAPLLRVYVRFPEQWPDIRAGLASQFDLEKLRYIALQAQICRRELLVEIEYSAGW